jgi:hypothetical protein
MIRKPLLIILAKTPRISHGKTRLARDVGRVQAWRINCAMQARVLLSARDPRWRVLLAVTPDRDRHSAIGVWPKDITRCGQGGGDLGVRLARLMAPHRRVAVLGVDCPAARAADISAVFKGLRAAPFAFGPAHDGGFWMMAARRGRDAAKAFADVRWSSAHTLSDVVARLGVRVFFAATLSDVDDLASLRAFRAHRSSGR